MSQAVFVPISSPASRALGITAPEASADPYTLTLGNSAGARKPGDNGVHEGAALVLIDQAMGGAIRALYRTQTPATTIDLRVDWLEPLLVDTLICRAWVVHQAKSIYTLAAELRGASGDRLAIATGRFLVGVHPGGASDLDQPEHSQRQPRRPFTSFQDLLGVIDGEPLLIAPADHLVGNPVLPAYHGGIIAAFLQEACVGLARRSAARTLSLMSINVNYLRPAPAVTPICARAHVVRAGSSVSIFSATLESEDAGVQRTTATVSLTR